MEYEKSIAETDFREEILFLISLCTEGEYWDYKLQWHSNNCDLLHDIICMANSLTNRDCYIIFGVSDSGEIRGVPSCSRKKQHNIINFLKDKPFACGVRPTIYVKTITLSEGCELDVLIIKSTSNVPYYLTNDNKDDGLLYRGRIYTRVGDTNTPKDSAADPDKIEWLWMKHFGLHVAPTERTYLYLQDTKGWDASPVGMESSEKYYYRNHPEYTLEICEIAKAERENKITEPNHNFFYLCAAHGVSVHQRIHFYDLFIRYHNTVILSCEIVSADEGNLRLATLQNECLTHDGTLSEKSTIVAAYIIKGSFQDTINTLISSLRPNNYKQKYGSGDILRVVPQFSDDTERCKFIATVNLNPDKLSVRISQEPNTHWKSKSKTDENHDDDINLSLRTGSALVKWLAEWRDK